MRRKNVAFRWTKRRSDAAVLLAQGLTENETADTVKVAERTVQRWKHDTEFAAEVDRLTLMVNISGRAYRMRLAMKMVRSFLTGTKIQNKPDNLLDWLKYAQSETDGIKLDIAGMLAALANDAPSVADERPDGDTSAADSQAEPRE